MTDIPDYRDLMTLDEMKANDLLMLEDAIKESRKYAMRTLAEAIRFQQHCMDCTLRYLGLQVNRPNNKFQEKAYLEKMMERMKEKNIVVETRTDYEDQDFWRNGTYVYKDGVLVTFISDIIRSATRKFVKAKLKMKIKTNGFFVCTNAKLDHTQRIWTPDNQTPTISNVPLIGKLNA